MGDRILMIDDDESLSAMVGEFLAPFGLELTARATARSGLDLLPQSAFDVLILDVMLPDIDGGQSLRGGFPYVLARSGAMAVR